MDQKRLKFSQNTADQEENHQKRKGSN
uniref:Uncharacterized protein n=1 Tax=Arundo donax TaxID=35708 RepID=A0A0A8YYF4_ARUDO